ncbi:hypothetical protein ACQP2T_10680 [Nonomuraea sp. CA-143628]|uniref:hypothetical protein n=1 Tax=Nonomuraea sp. CA-143628 TaxID=3239997 RepID=UPI003D90642E
MAINVGELFVTPDLRDELFILRLRRTMADLRSSGGELGRHAGRGGNSNTAPTPPIRSLPERGPMAELLETLPQREYTDITIGPFLHVFDGVLFGLVIEQGRGDQEDEDDWAELFPDRLGFCEPWDGQYST